MAKSKKSGTGQGMEIDTNDDDEWEGVSGDEVDISGLGELGKIARVRRRQQQRNIDSENDTKKMKLKTIKTRPGAMKRKAAMEEKERERFARNMASMSVPVPTTQKTVAAEGDGVAKTAGSGESDGVDDRGSRDKWAALRGFIGQTLETNPMFKK